MAFVRILRDLMRDKDFGPRVVPIIPDEARTFGMGPRSSRPPKIYNPHGQQYTSVDRELMLATRSPRAGRSCTSGSTRRARSRVHRGGQLLRHAREPMVPIYIFYSMFGFQRTGDALWAAADQMARGFLIGATAGRTTLTGEGLAARRRHSPLLAVDEPRVVSYDPGLRYEIGPHRQRRAAPDVRRGAGERHLLPHGVQRADGAAARARGPSTSTA
jgi:pyruvate dehydrogenase E1 component